nr:MAG TPA: hypothetical protein [Caudoviricetes sp.]
MEAEKIIKEKEIVHEEGKKHATDNSARALGIVGTVLGGVAVARLWGGRGGGLFGGGNWGGGMPENVNINTMASGTGYGTGAPTAFMAWEKSCEDAIALTNAMWGLKVSGMQADYDHRNTDVAEKFQLYQSQVNGDFGNYKAIRDLNDYQTEKLNNAAFGLYKSQVDGFAALNARICHLEKEVAVGAAIRPYQDKLIQCEIDRAFTASVNYTNRLDCRNIKGELVLPNTPVVSGYGSYRNCGCGFPNASTSGEAV